MVSIKTFLTLGIIGGGALALILFRDRIGGLANQVGSSLGNIPVQVGQGFLQPFQDFFGSFTTPSVNAQVGVPGIPLDVTNVPNALPPDDFEQNAPFIAGESVDATTQRVIAAANQVLQEFSDPNELARSSSERNAILDTGDIGFDNAAELLLEASRQVNPELGTAGIFDRGDTANIEGLPLSQEAVDFYARIGVPLNRLF